MRRLLVVTSVIAALGACTSPPGPSPAPPTEAAASPGHGDAARPPDVVIVTLDTTRADHLGAYGYFRDTSPTLDALAKRSVLFERLVVPMATTAPTHTSLMTATWPHEHGVLANTEHGGRRLPSDGLLPLAAWLQSEGYATAAFVSASPLDTSSGLQRGFGVYDVPEGAERTGDQTTERALAWLGGVGDGPLLLWVHYYDPHNPWRAPASYVQRFHGPDPALDAHLAKLGVATTTRRPTGQRVAARPAWNQYDAEVAFMDAQVGRLLDAVDARGRDTLLVVMGDHGEGLNQHGEPGHGLVWDEQLHAPLLIRAPGAAPRRVPTVLSAADVLPTALGLVDLPHEERFLQLASGADVLAPGFVERPVLSQMSARQLSFGKALAYALTGPKAKCRWSEGEPSQLWDLSNDPHELGSLDDPPALAACVEQGRAVVAHQRERGDRLGAGATVEMSPEERQRLVDLGYLDPG